MSGTPGMANDPLFPYTLGSRGMLDRGSGTEPLTPELLARLHQAAELYSKRDLPGLMAVCQAIIASSPGECYAEYFLGLIALEQGRVLEARKRFARAFAAGLQDAVAHFQYARLLAESGDVETATMHLELALRLRPEYLAPRRLLAELFLSRAAFEEASRRLEQASWGSGARGVARQQLGLPLFFLGSPSEPRSEAEPVVDLPPRWDGVVHTGLAKLLESSGHANEAEIHARYAVGLNPNRAHARTVLARLQRQRGALGEALASARIACETAPAGEVRAEANEERGTVLERLGRYGEAFLSFQRGKHALRECRGTYHNPDAELTEFHRSAEFFTQEAVEQLFDLLPRPLPGRIRPLFIIRFPGSGASLLEQALSRHSAIAACPQADPFRQLENELAVRTRKTYPDSLRALLDAGDGVSLLAVRKVHLARMRAHTATGTATRWITNVIEPDPWHLPLIRALFPDAPLVELVRHPLDTLVTCYFRLFDSGHEWSYDLTDIAVRLRRLFRESLRMKKLLGTDFVRISYEGLRSGPSTELARLFAALGLREEPGAPHNAAPVRSYRHTPYVGFLPNGVLKELSGLIRTLGYREGHAGGRG